jgi:transcriptional regulator with XRE-family HTH domain
MNRLNEILKKKGVSQAHISREIGKAPNTVNNWCRNVTQFTLPEAAQLAAILGVSLEELLDQNDTKEANK